MNVLSEVDLSLLKLQEPLWVDARGESFFQKEHIPGAVNLNRKNWEQSLSALFESYGEGRTIIVYCAAGCHESHVIAAKIRELGLEDVRIFEGGFEAWKEFNAVRSTR